MQVQQRLLRRGGVNVDAEMAIVEADHGSPARAVELARRGMGGGAQRAQRRRARVGADARRPARRGPDVRAARAAARLPGCDVPLPRRHRRARRRRRRRTLPAATSPARWRANRASRRCTPASARARCWRPAMRFCATRWRSSAVLLVAAFATGEAVAHPLGNFSVNHLTAGRDLPRPRRRCSTYWTRPRSRPSRNAASPPPRCSTASAPRWNAG